MTATRQRRALGRGLDALLSPLPAAAPLDPGIPVEPGSSPADPPSGERLVQIPVESMRPGLHQPRVDFDEEGLTELAQSLRQHGVLQPLLVRAAGEGYEIVAGERRWRAARVAGLDRLPALLVDAAEGAILEMAVAENVQRADLNPMEIAAAFASMMERLGLTQEEVAARVGKERSTVANYVRLLKLPPRVQEEVATGRLSMGHARAILSLRSEGEMIAFARKAIDKSLSVRQLEEMLRRTLAGPRAEGAKYVRSPSGDGPTGPQAIFLREMAGRFRATLGTKVSIQGDEKKGKIVIEYYSEEMLEGLVERLG